MKIPLIAAIALAGTLTVIPSALAEESTLERTTDSVGGLVDDAAITTKIKAAYAKDDTVSAMKVKVDTNGGVVTLAGTAKTQAEADLAEQIASATEGVTSVRNDIVISPD